ncbi:MAG: CvpA family protein [Planctomycetes bacterium]|nr:CvpA family protein [Planctomycetota bacterium]
MVPAAVGLLYFAVLDAAPTSGEWPWVDLLGLLFLAVFGFLGLLRGLWWQVVRLLGVLAAILVARTFADVVSDALRGFSAALDPRVAHGVAWSALFVLALCAAALLGQLGKSALETLQLDLLDRIGGLLAGLLTGLLCFSAFLIGLGLLAPRHWLLEHVPGTRSAVLVDVCARRVPLLLRDAAELPWSPTPEPASRQGTEEGT